MMFMNQNGSVCISVFVDAGYSAEPLVGAGQFLIMKFMNQNGSVCISVFVDAGYSAEPLVGAASSS